MLKKYTKKSDVNVYLAAAESLGLDYKILSKRNPTVVISNGKLNLLFRNTSPSFNSLAGHEIASDKYMTAKLLKQEGVPVPEQKIFALDKISEIVTFAEANYPVVVKRNKGAGGDDVHVDIRNTKHLLQAIDSILASTAKHILVEQYIKGNDYRIIVFRGAIIDVIKRVPAYVIGDGSSTIEELIHLKNIQRVKILGGYPIVFDSRVIQILSESGLTKDSIPKKDAYIQLKKSCNYSTGGETKKVSLSEIHPDNIELFIKIQNISFLEYTGIDYISSDLSKSWKETNSVINEINSSIGIDTHYYADMSLDLSAPRKVLAAYFNIALD